MSERKQPLTLDLSDGTSVTLPPHISFARQSKLMQSGALEAFQTAQLEIAEHGQSPQRIGAMMAAASDVMRVLFPKPADWDRIAESGDLSQDEVQDIIEQVTEHYFGEFVEEDEEATPVPLDSGVGS